MPPFPAWSETQDSSGPYVLDTSDTSLASTEDQISQVALIQAQTLLFERKTVLLSFLIVVA
jgi:hypothetical protein